jgi:hypothetical protein
VEDGRDKQVRVDRVARAAERPKSWRRRKKEANNLMTTSRNNTIQVGVAADNKESNLFAQLCVVAGMIECMLLRKSPKIIGHLGRNSPNS